MIKIRRLETLEKYGYDPIALKTQSAKIVIWQCKLCNKVRETPLYRARERCKSCKNVRLTADTTPIKTETKYIHGQYVKVKIYKEGATSGIDDKILLWHNFLAHLPTYAGGLGCR